MENCDCIGPERTWHRKGDMPNIQVTIVSGIRVMFWKIHPWIKGELFLSHCLILFFIYFPAYHFLSRFNFFSSGDVFLISFPLIFPNCYFSFFFLQ